MPWKLITRNEKRGSDARARRAGWHESSSLDSYMATRSVRETARLRLRREIHGMVASWRSPPASPAAAGFPQCGPITITGIAPSAARRV